MKILKFVILLLLLVASSVRASSFLGGVGALGSSKFLLQTADANLPNAQAMGALPTGLVFNTTTTGVQSIYTTSGTGTVACLTTSCVMVTPTLGSAVGTDASVSGGLFARGNTGVGSANAVQAEVTVSAAGTIATFAGYNRGAATYQPVQFIGSTFDFQIAGVSKATIDATGKLISASGSFTGVTALGIRDTSAAFDVTIAATDPATISAGRTLTLGMGNVAHTLNFGTTANTITFPNIASGTVAMLNAANAFSSGSNTFTAINNVFGSTLAINGNGGSTQGIASTTMATGGTALTAVSGATRLVDFGAVFSPTSGTATFASLNVTSTINQTGGASGISRALYINPTITAAADFRAIETVTGSIFLGGLSTGTNADTLCLASTGQVLIQAAACTISKRHLKEHFAPIHDALAMVMALNPQEFSMKQTVPANRDINFTRPQFGFIAEDVYAVDARLSVVDPDGITPKTWRTEAVVAVLVGAIQELTQDVERLKHHAVH